MKHFLPIALVLSLLAGVAHADGPLNPGAMPALPLSAANGGTGNAGGAFSTFAPAPSCGTATFTVTSANYQKVGKLTVWSAEILFTSTGTCGAGSPLSITAPAVAQKGGGGGGADYQTGVAVGCFVLASTSNISCFSGQGAAWSATSRVIVSGQYENQ